MNMFQVYWGYFFGFLSTRRNILLFDFTEILTGDHLPLHFDGFRQNSCCLSLQESHFFERIA